MGEKAIESILERFSFDYTIELTQEEELAIIKSLTEDDFIDSGSSRIVYSLGSKYVVKIALSTGGVNQNNIERNFYACHGHSNCFAHLFAYGKMINIMEYLCECSYYDPDDFYYDEDDEDAAHYHMIEELIDTANDITGYYGGDNGQIGYSEARDIWVLYDYGYSMDFDRGEIVDEADYWMGFIEVLHYAAEVVGGSHMLTQDEFEDYCESKKEEIRCSAKDL